MTRLVNYFGFKVEEGIIAKLDKEISKRNKIKADIINETYKGEFATITRTMLLRNMSKEDSLNELFTQILKNESYAKELGLEACRYLGEKVITNIDSSDNYLFIEKEEKEFSRFAIAR